MKRFAENYLKEWLVKNNRKPLIIRGARQVGKSTLVRNFASSIGMDLYEINLERHIVLADVFKSLDINKILKEISGLLKKEIRKDNAILFLDEIQAVPEAIAALRYFYEEMPELPIICAGSLLEFALAKHNFSMPVGRIEYFFLGPMSFEEYLEAKNESYLLESIINFNVKDTFFPKTIHEKLLELQREYLIIGGMPEAVKVYLDTEEFTKVFDVHNSIIMTYQDDFAKYASSKELLLLHKIFNYVPRNLGKKVKYSNISPDNKSGELKPAIDLLARAGVINKIIHSNCSGLPISAEVNDKIYKLLFLDIGLMNRLCGLEWDAISSLDNRLLVNEGSIAEQFVGQHLLYMDYGKQQPCLHYWLREGKSSNAEVDYVISCSNIILPIEVKSGKAGTLKSLVQFIGDKKSNLALRIDLNPFSIQKLKYKLNNNKNQKEIDCPLISLPMYMIGQIKRIILDFI